MHEHRAERARGLDERASELRGDHGDGGGTPPVLDARGAVSTTERTKAFSLMRNLVRDCARLWVEIRDELVAALATRDVVTIR